MVAYRPVIWQIPRKKNSEATGGQSTVVSEHRLGTDVPEKTKAHTTIEKRGVLYVVRVQMLCAGSFDAMSSVEGWQFS
jgi:hypothetical protein